MIILLYYKLKSVFFNIICRSLNYINKTTYHVKQELMLSKNKRLISNVDIEKYGLDNQDKPIIFVSACENKKNIGGNKFNGGIKMLNLLIKLLREKGYEAYVVTYDGSYVPWLVEHQPHISIKEFRNFIEKNPNIRCVTSWAQSFEFIKHSKKIYFWDMELKYSDNDHYSNIYYLLKRKKMKVAGVNSMVCAWHISEWRTPCTLLTNWIDIDYWYADETKRITNRIGYMKESNETYKEIKLIEKQLAEKNIKYEFFEIKGSEQECIAQMQTCNIFLGMNHGKDRLWGEGFGLPMLEAMFTGCIVISYDIIGNREFIIDNFNGILVSRGNYQEMSDIIVGLNENPTKMDSLRQNMNSFIHNNFTAESRWGKVKEFLEL